MKKILAIISIAMVATVFSLAGCKKQEAATPAVQSTSTMTAPTATVTAPAHK